MVSTYLQYWNLYRNQWRAGLINEKHRAKYISYRGLMDTSSPDGEATPRPLWYLASRGGNREDNSILEAMENKEKAAFQLGMKFLEAASVGNYPVIREITATGFNVNFTDPRSGGTALHAVASSGSRTVLRALIEAPDLDFLIKDKRGRLPSLLALAANPDPVVARYLRWRERKEAKLRGIDYATYAWD